MIALDTNVLARFYIEDEADAESRRQRAIARAVLASDRKFFVPLTVVQELEWVMRGAYGFARDETTKVLDHLLDLPNLDVDAAAAVRQATEWHRRGLDFSDALHLALSASRSELATFDRKVVMKVARLRAKPPASAPKV
ncbi:MAG TPA: type II toxin-antitoxin system VapC family toxin [Burkholderiales bacterium]|nr:type II toxin-antitoxin system VapC family toxin [Burkholderiales bacterium]